MVLRGKPPLLPALVGPLRFVFSPPALIDLLAVLPFYLSLGLLDLRFLRLVRRLRLLKVTRYVRALHVLGQVVRRKRAKLLVSSVMYSIKSVAQTDKFGSIPGTMWWGVATLTTVGYGDVYPITSAGKVFSSSIAVLGLGLFAIPTGILASGFSEQLQERQTATAPAPSCPQCAQRQFDQAQREVALLTKQLLLQGALLQSKDQLLANRRDDATRPD